MASLGTGGKKESTEWDDILKSKGIIPEKSPDEIAQEQLKELVEETVEAYDPHENKNVNQLDEDLEDADSDEERILQSYREKRLQEMKSNAMKVRYGPGVTQISASDWKQEVSEARKDTVVVVHLYADTVEASKLMDARLSELSAKFRETKFVRCKGCDAIKNYPEGKCPTILVYKGGKVLKQFVGLQSFNTSSLTADDLEWALSRVGAVESDMVEPPAATGKRFNIRRI